MLSAFSPAHSVNWKPRLWHGHLAREVSKHGLEGYATATG